MSHSQNDRAHFGNETHAHSMAAIKMYQRVHLGTGLNFIQIKFCISYTVKSYEKSRTLGMTVPDKLPYIAETTYQQQPQ